MSFIAPRLPKLGSDVYFALRRLLRTVRIREYTALLPDCCRRGDLLGVCTELPSVMGPTIGGIHPKSLGNGRTLHTQSADVL